MNKDITNKIIETLMELYQSQEEYKSCFDWAASRTNDSAETTIDRLSSKANISRENAISFARAIEDAECGCFIVGRKGSKSRIKWKYSLKSLGETAQGKTENLKEVSYEAIEDAIDQQLLGETVSQSPNNLTIAEAKQHLAQTLGVSVDAIEIIVRA